MRTLRLEFRWSNCGDPWGRCQAWRFALCDYLLHRGLTVPSEWHFRQSPYGPDRDCEEWKTLARRNDSAGTLARFGALLARLAKILEAQGRDY